MFSIGSFTLTTAEVDRRKSYLELTPDDEKRLQDAHPVLTSQARDIIDRFYEYLLSHEYTRRILSAPGLVDRLKELQTAYFKELTSGKYDLAYFENRLRVGQTHYRIGLAPEWYMGAYVKFLHVASDVLSHALGRDYERFFQTIVSLTKVIYLDMGLALDAYHYSLQAAKQQLTDLIVHDLQNPLAGVMGVLQTLQGNEKLSSAELEALHEAVTRCNDLTGMIHNVLEISRAEVGKLKVFIEEMDASSLSKEAADAFRRQAEQQGRRIRVEVPPSAPVRTDQGLVSRILQNLLRNALRHTPAGTDVVIQVDATDLSTTTVSVKDSGPGIPVHVQALLFEPFGAAALRSAGVRVDTGLGLASCRIAARALGGDIVVQSDGQNGSTFTLSIPKNS